MCEVSQLVNEELKIFGAYAKFQKAAISIVKSVRLSACNKSAQIGRILKKFDVGDSNKICRKKTRSVKDGQH